MTKAAKVERDAVSAFLAGLYRAVEREAYPSLRDVYREIARPTPRRKEKHHV